MNEDFRLDIADVESIVHLLVSVSEPELGLSIADRKRLLADGVRQLIDADVFMWNTAVAEAESVEHAGAICVIDGGWNSPEQKFKVVSALHDPEFGMVVNKGILSLERRGPCYTGRREDFIDEETWERLGLEIRLAGLPHCMLCVYPLSPPSFSAIGFYRVTGKPPFSIRDRSIVEVVFGEVEWLHRHGVNVEAGRKSLRLSPRERQVLVYLLQGMSLKEIAVAGKLSKHTIGDYVKNVYKQFGVHSRGELQAIFLVCTTESGEE